MIAQHFFFFFTPAFFFFFIVNFIVVVTVDLCILFCFQAECELGSENVVSSKVLVEESDKHQIVSITSGRACINRSGGFHAFYSSSKGMLVSDWLVREWAGLWECFPPFTLFLVMKSSTLLTRNSIG